MYNPFCKGDPMGDNEASEASGGTPSHLVPVFNILVNDDLMN